MRRPVSRPRSLDCPRCPRSRRLPGLPRRLRGLPWPGASRTAVLALVAAAALAAAALAACRAAGAGAAAPGAPGAPGGASAEAAAAVTGSSGAVVAVRRGDLQPRLLLTGELRAARARAVTVPATPSFEVQIRWLAEDGSRVAAGKPVVEFDNSSFLAKLEEQRLAAATATADLARIQAQDRADEADKEFGVEQARADLAKARIAAAVPAELVSRRDYQDYQLKLQQAQSALSKEVEGLAAQRAKGAAEVGVQQIVLDQARRDLAATTAAIGELTVRAERDSLVVVGEHPVEGRKYQAGDHVWAGMAVATLPETSSMLVEAALSDVDDGRVAPGMPATCILDAYPAIRYRGRVVEVAGVARESRRTALLRSIAVSIALDPLPPREAARMRAGMSVRAEIAAQPVRGALLVPRAALDLADLADLSERGAPPRVRLAGGGVAPVRLGPCDAFWCVAASGVTEGQALQALPPQPLSPVAPPVPATPAIPAAPPTSAAPAAPATLAASVAPAAPAISAAPLAPAAPATLAAPVAPATLAASVAPAAPAILAGESG